MMTEIYRQEDAQQILQIAIARQAEAGELSRTQLLEIAEELNIATSDIEAAEREWLSRQSEQVERQSFQQMRQQKFKNRLVRYLIINGFLIVINIMSAGTLTWSLYVALFLGIGVALEAWQTYWSNGDLYERSFQRWRKKRQLKKSVDSLLNRWLGV